MSLRDAIRAITYQNFEMVMVLLRNGADVNVPSDYGSILHLAVRLRSVEIVRALIDNGADVNYRHQDESPLHHALRAGRIDVIKRLLMQENIDIDSPERLGGPGRAPLLFALPYHKSVGDLLVKRNVDTTGAQTTSLHWAAETNDYEEIVQSLLNQGCPVDALDRRVWKNTTTCGSARQL
ncbi:hypothetical protein EMCG_08597 [[Emmonsia] crescens]|uniref:Uncharacterized protein n=1 Tax=[Emmonsia] crescens TaxID=73230 RepID=A0A0G2I4M3_9EURO|nr:hypothetical protein EMCG_08597 [Emmonsia crescens UAMH 3008]